MIRFLTSLFPLKSLRRLLPQRPTPSCFSFFISHFSFLHPHFSFFIFHFSFPHPLPLLIYFSFFIFHFSFTSCSTSGCLENQSALPKALFYSSQGTIASIDSLQVWGVGSPGDSLLIDGRASATYLPLRSAATAAAFCFHYTQHDLSSPALNDTLTLTYTSSPRFISEECGAMYFYTISSLSVTHHLIDSVRLTDSLVTNFDKETLRIFFRTQSSEPSQPTEP